MTNKLPQGWVECEFESVIDVRDGTHDSPKYYETGYPLVTSKCLKNGNIDLSIASLISENDYHKINERSKVSIGDVLFAMIGTIGNPVLIQDEPSFAIKNVALFRKSNAVIPEFLKYYLESSNVLSVMQLQSKGSTQKFVGLGYLRKFNFLLPPLNEQKRIVEKIEEEFGMIDKGIEKLKLAQEQIKQYRQSVLKSAFDGKLYKTSEWKEKTLEEITSILGDGLHGTPKYSENGEYYFINGNNLNDGKILIKDDTKKVDEEEYQKHKKDLNENTVFVSINGTLGNTAFYNNEKIILGKSACYFNLLPIANKKFIRFLLKTNNFMNYANLNATGSTIKNVSLKSMRAYKVNLPTLDEQKQIVKEIEKRFEVADEVERVITENLEKAEQLKQSILKKAFEGRLVPQDPTDEPASVLLDRINTERGK